MQTKNFQLPHPRPFSSLLPFLPLPFSSLLPLFLLSHLFLLPPFLHSIPFPIPLFPHAILFLLPLFPLLSFFSPLLIPRFSSREYLPFFLNLLFKPKKYAHFKRKIPPHIPIYSYTNPGVIRIYLHCSFGLTSLPSLWGAIVSKC